MTITGIDCGAPLTLEKAKAFRAAGIAFAGRYVTPNSWKTLTKPEAELLRAAGLQILSVFERTADRTRGGATSGAEDGAEAFSHARTIGQPLGSAIYFAVDYDAPAGDINLIEAYLRAAASHIPGYKLGVYGSYTVIEEMAKRIPGIYCWQTRAWSRGKISPQAHVYQKQIDDTAHDHKVDWNDLYREAGLWGGTPEGGDLMLNKEDAEKIIALLGAVWSLIEVPGPATASQNEVHRLANEIRKAANLPVQEL